MTLPLKRTPYDTYNKYPQASLGTDLNDVECDGLGSEGFRDNSITDNSQKIQVYFRNLTEHLVKHIEEADVILGCVAWLTSDRILDALAQKNDVSIVVQKEDFLRPDMGHSSSWKYDLRLKYEALRTDLYRYSLTENIICSLNVCSDSMLNTIRCAGNHNREKLPAAPRMHNKFLVFAKRERNEEYFDRVSPYAVWTGSFNFSKNAGMSLENALYITDETIARAYYREYGQIYAISEPLDWESDWCFGGISVWH